MPPQIAAQNAASRSMSRNMRNVREKEYGGEGGIRTHGRISPTHAFQACSLNRSDTSPRCAINLAERLGSRSLQRDGSITYDCRTSADRSRRFFAGEGQACCIGAAVRQVGDQALPCKICAWSRAFSHQVFELARRCAVRTQLRAARYRFFGERNPCPVVAHPLEFSLWFSRLVDSTSFEAFNHHTQRA